MRPNWNKIPERYQLFRYLYSLIYSNCGLLLLQKDALHIWYSSASRISKIYSYHENMATLYLNYSSTIWYYEIWIWWRSNLAFLYMTMIKTRENIAYKSTIFTIWFVANLLFWQPPINFRESVIQESILMIYSSNPLCHLTSGDITLVRW